MFFTYKSSSLELRERDGYMQLVNLYSKEPGKGHATSLLTKVCEYADQHGVTIQLIAKQYGNSHGLSNEQLSKLYERFGFNQNGSGMIRKPQDLQRV